MAAWWKVKCYLFLINIHLFKKRGLLMYYGLRLNAENVFEDSVTAGLI